MNKKEYIKKLIKLYESTGRCAWYYSRSKEISLNGRTMPERIAINQIKELLQKEGIAINE